MSTVLAINPTFVGMEIKRILRNRRFLIFAAVLPAVLYLFIGGAGGSGSNAYRPDGLDYGAFIMIGLATFGAVNAMFSMGGRIALERSTGWSRLLRLTSLTGRQYVVGKVLSGFAISIPSIFLVFLIGATKNHIDLPVTRWVGAGVSLLLALLPIAALGILVGYLFKADTAQAAAGIVSIGMSLLGGVWFSVGNGWAEKLVELLPFYWISGAGRSVLKGSWLGWHGLAVLVIWTVVLGALAARAYRNDGERV